MAFAIVIAVVFAALFVTMWCVVLGILAHVSGWSRLATSYSDVDKLDDVASPPQHKVFSMQSGRIGTVSYKTCLTLTFSQSGLGLTVMLPFRLGHPPLMIPWAEFHNLREQNHLFGSAFLHADIGHPVIGSIQLPAWVSDHFPQPEHSR